MRRLYTATGLDLRLLKLIESHRRLLVWPDENHIICRSDSHAPKPQLIKRSNVWLSVTFSGYQLDLEVAHVFNVVDLRILGHCTI